MYIYCDMVMDIQIVVRKSDNEYLYDINHGGCYMHYSLCPPWHVDARACVRILCRMNICIPRRRTTSFLNTNLIRVFSTGR